MLDMTFRRKLTGLLDDVRSEHLSLETKVLSSPAVGLARVRQAEQLADILETQFEEMDRLTGDDEISIREAAKALRGHALYRDIFLQSAFVSQKALGLAGGPFSFRYRRMIFDRPDIGYSPFAQLLNDALLDMPLCRAIRTLSQQLSTVLVGMPQGSRILGLGCSPATEILSLPASARGSMGVTLMEPDAEAAAHIVRHAGQYLPSIIASDRVDQLPAGDQWQLILAPHILPKLQPDPDGSDKAAQLVRDLFQRLTPGGRLLMASPLPTGNGNAYKHSQRMLVDGDETQAVVHRSPAELIGLTALLPDGGFTANLLAEDLSSAISSDTVLAVLSVEAPV